MDKGSDVYTQITDRKRMSRFLGVTGCSLSLLLAVAGCSASTSGGATSEDVAHSSAAMSQGLAGAPPNSDSVKRDKTSGGSAGMLIWSGFVNGRKSFASAGCAENGKGQLGTFMAPFQGKRLSTGGTPGPGLDIGIFPSGSITVLFTTDRWANERDNSFQRRGVKLGDGFKWEINNGNYVITLTNFKIPNMNLRDQKEIVLNGTLVCTRLTNG